MNDQPSPLVLGHRLRDTAEGITVVSRSASLTAHIGKPWLNAYIKEHFDIVVDPPQTERVKRGEAFTIDPTILATNTAICGRPGKGKTRIALHLFREELKAGCSALLIDIQDQTLSMAIHVALEVGLKPEQITVVRTNYLKSVAGWNPFDRPPEERRAAVKHFVAMILGILGTGSRLGPLLNHAATLIASQRLSIMELVAFLRPGSDYRVGLLAKIAASPEAASLQYEINFFRDFSTWTIAKQSEFVDPVLARLSLFATEPFFQAFLGARTDHLDFASLWKRQRLILVLMDETEMNETEVAIMAGLLTSTFLSTAMRHPKSDPVACILFMDEMGIQQKFAGEAVARTIAQARQKNVRVMAALQYLTQLPDNVRTAVLGSSCQVFFGLVNADAAIIARNLADGFRTKISKIAVTAGTERYYFKAFIVDDTGHRISVQPKFWEEVKLKEGNGRTVTLQGYADTCRMGTLHIAYRTHRIPLTELRPDDWHFLEPSPLTIMVSFPRPKVDVITRQTQSDRAAELENILKSLPKQQAIVWAEGEQAEIQVVNTDFPDELPNLDDYMGNGQSAEEIAATTRWREEQMDSIAGRKPAPAKAAVKTKATPPVPPILELEIPDDGAL